MAYNNSIIYKLHCNITGDDYYGSTTNYKSRICSHKCKTEKELSKRNCVSKQIILRGDYTFSIVGEYNCETRKQLLKRERYYIENNKCRSEERQSRKYARLIIRQVIPAKAKCPIA